MSLIELLKKAEQAFLGQTITASHLLLVMAEEEERELGRILAPSGLSVQRFKEVLRPLADDPVEEDREIILECMALGQGSTTGWHLLKTLRDKPGHRITHTLVQAGMDLEGLAKGLKDNAPQNPLVALRSRMAEESALFKYGRDLTAEAASGAFDDLCPRPKQLESLIRILLRKERPNPVLTGPAGVGKTALVELLARQLARGEMPEKLLDTRVFEISMGKLVAGTKYRGELEARFEAVIKALRKVKSAILFIDEFHLVWGAGRAEGAPMDVANLLKPELSRGRLRVIGATTSEEYHRYIELDPALARRFNELRLEEPQGEVLLEILKKKRMGLQNHHEVAIPDLILTRAMELTELHLPNRHQPAKTIDLLDTSAASVVRRGGTELTEEDLLEALEDQTGRPLTGVGDEERHRLLELKDRLREKIIGQDGAIDKVVSTLIYRRQHLGEEERNMGSFLFIGNTGVGKTELARQLAVEMFGSEDALLRLDMAEYKGFDALHKLIGASLSIPNSREGVLASWLYQRGTGVILFDEIEKANPEVHQLLLGMLDRGRISDGRGEELDTRQCVIIFTSNALSPEALKKEQVGFKTGEEMGTERDITGLLAEEFPREFLGRLDEIILFNDLGDEELKQILKIHVARGLNRFLKEGVMVEYDEVRLLDHLIDGLRQAKESGARGVKRVLERMFLQPIAMAVASYSGKKPMIVTLTDEFYRTGKVEIAPGKGGREDEREKQGTARV